MEDIDKEITVNVRSPSLNETLEIKTVLNATILTLKKSIEPVHPHRPKTINQRIIYSGKLLKDSDILAEVLKKIDEEVIPTFHLVVKPSLDSAMSRAQTPVSATTNSYPQSQQQQQQQQQPSSSSPSPFSNPISSEGMPQNTGFAMPQYQQQQQQPQPMYPSSLPGGYQVVSINGQYYLAPTLVLSQNLSPQQTFNTHNLPTAQPPLYQHQANATSFSSPQPQQPQQPQPQPQPQPQQQQQQQQQEPIVQPYINQLPQQQQQNNPLFGGNVPILVRPANAQRAASIWLALKLIVVLFMVCQGASIERIFIFHAIAFVFFFYQTGRLRFVLRRVRVEDLNRFRPGGGGGGLQRPAGPAPNAPNVDANAEGASTSVNNANNLHQRRQNNGESSSTSNEDDASDSAAANEPARPLTALDVWKRGAYTFFASLWPTYGIDPQIAQAFQNDNNNQEQQD